MLTVGIICALVATASAGYASSSSGASAGTGSGLYGGNAYQSTYSSNYPYTNNYVGYSAGGGVPYVPVGFASPYDFQNQFQQYFNALSAFNANLFNQQLAQQAAIQHSVAANLNAIREQATYGNRFGYGGASSGGYVGSGYPSGGYANGGSYASTGGSTGTYGGVGGGGSTYGGTYSSGGRPNYAASGGHVSSGHQGGFAHVSPPVLNSRFGDEGVVSQSVGTPGVVGVSSFSSSSDINGHRHRESGTSINNNGKVTHYYNRSP